MLSQASNVVNSSPVAQPVPVEALVRRVQDLVPSLRERADRIAQARRQPDDVIRDLYDADLMELMRPRRYGGREYGIDALCKVGRELARGDGSTSWVYLVTAAHDVFMGLFPASVQDEYWNSSRPVGASSYAPTGKATPASGGFTLNGKWSFCSGIDQAGWVLLGAIVGMLEEPRRPDMRYFMVPISDVKIIDDWHVMGLRGTGSKSVVVENCFVPDERIITFSQIIAGLPFGGATPEAPDYRESIWVAIGYSLAAPATGIAQTAYEHVVKELRGRMERVDPVFTARKPALQMHLAEASALIDTSDLIFSRSVNVTLDRVAARVRLNDQERARNRLDTCYSIVAARKGVELLMSMTGGHGIAENHPVQRALRDLYAIGAHPATGFDSPALSFGSVALGGPLLEPMA
jgi:alkylation response protein AidB-like acyl-CoA dehydrogenase